MISLENKSQAEIEQMFSRESIKEALLVGVEVFYSQVQDEDIQIIRNMTKVDDIDELMLHLIALIGNPEMGERRYDPYTCRAIRPSNIAKPLARNSWMVEHFPEIQSRHDIALNIIGQLDGVFYDIVYKRTYMGDDQWKMLDECLVGFDVDLDDAVDAELKFFRFPLIEQPLDWKEHSSGGYHLNQSKCTLNRGEANQPQVCLDLLNKLQHNTYKTTNAHKQDLQDYVYTQLLEKYPKVVANSITKDTTITAGEVFETMKDYEFMFQWNFDFRGRMYSTGYDINLQGDKYRKGTIYPTRNNFENEPQTTSQRAYHWLAIDCANRFGLDKLSFNDRVKWTRNNYQNLENMREKAESPWEFDKAVKAIRTAAKGELPEHMVYLDASNQALQLFAVLTGDLQTAQTCNMANGNNIADAYKMLANAMNRSMNLTCFNRSNCKKALMTTMYGKLSGWTKILEAMYPKSRQSLVDFAEEYNLELSYNKDSGAAELPVLDNAFSEALRDIAPKAMLAMEAIQALNDKDIGTYQWTLSDGFRVKYNVSTQTKILCQTTSRSGKELKLELDKKIYVSSEFNRGMAPNVIHSVDGWVAREMIRRMNGKFITTIHDAFACHPNNCDLMINNYKDIMVELLHSDLLNNILTQIGHTPIEMIKEKTLTEKHIRDSVYALS